MDDLISRAAAIEIIQSMYPGMPRVPWLRKDWQKRYEPYIRTENAIKELPPAQPEPNYDEWCTDCKEYDQEKHCCPRWNRVIRETLKDAQPVSQWVPCSERLPEVHESGNHFSGIFMQSLPVLVYGICEGEENAQFHVVTYCDDLDGNTYWSTELDALTITKVTAWMPLPEPYKERREE